ncbi:UDP-diphosphatase [Candidatus Falkowbacteria bacterium]|nr:UDP-diphosphatase [Candidatus Falkowbacteria bacterium]
MLEAIVLGITQGVAEWLPVSSEGLIFLIKANFFAKEDSLIDIVRLALFLHFGTFLSALVYFRKDVARLLKALFRYKKAEAENKKIINFLIIATLISAVLGSILVAGMKSVETDLKSIAGYVNLIIGGLLIITAFLQIKIKKAKDFGKSEKDLKAKDGVFLGIAQGMAALPGLSRSGLTVSALLMSEFRDNTALRLSFLMSMPIVLGANIVLNLGDLSADAYSFVALAFAFVFGLLTIDVLLKVAKKVNFGYFVLGFAILMIISSFL